MDSQNAYASYINSAITSISYPAQPKGLYAPIAYTLDCGGKRIRPVLMLAAAEAVGGDREAVVNQALGLEMFHNFTLLHDDVMDRADLRRGRPTVHVKWNEATAILSGDAMLTMASQLMGRGCGDKLAKVMALFNATAMEIYEGQQYDMDFESRIDVTVDEYLDMIRLKTAVLLGASCCIGVIMGGGNESMQKAFYDYGIALGLAFQLQDDWLDTFGNSDVFGKSIGGDILNDKKTYLLISAMMDADETTLSELKSMFGTRTPDKVTRVREIYVKLGIDTKCRNLIESYVAKAINCLDEIEIGSEAREFFTNIARQSLTRQS